MGVRFAAVVSSVVAWGCGGISPPPPPPPAIVPRAPVDSQGSGSPTGVNVVFDVEGGSGIVRLQLFQESAPLCAKTPCLTRLDPGAFDMIVQAGPHRSCATTIQIPRKPTIVRFSVPEPGEWADCGVNLWSPEDGRIYDGEVQ